MNQVIFANDCPIPSERTGAIFEMSLVPISDAGSLITDKPNEDFIIEYMTPSKTIKTIEVNRETLNIQKISNFDTDYGGEYTYAIETLYDGPLDDVYAIQLIRQDAVPHQRNSWYIELSIDNLLSSFWNQLKVLSKSDLLGITEIDEGNQIFKSKYPFTFKLINCSADITSYNIKSPYQYLQMLLTKHVQNFGYNHTDDNAELNSGLADYKAWIAGTEEDDTVAVYRLRFATNRKASKTRDERVWQNVYICTKGEENEVAALLDDYIAILNGEETEGGE